ncbi:MAG: alpha/beta fold hydrolase [Wenzhouxiangellaceae bacterium]|nr:alpha/beta fold hydrolase [Wenzhouxiangellaceae bacterium]
MLQASLPTTDCRVLPGKLPSRPPVDASVAHPRLGTIRYRTLGEPGLAPLVVVGGISADRKVDHWWPDITAGDEGGLSPRRFRLISIDWLAQLRCGRPVQTGDQADALLAVINDLGLDRIEALVGASYGAMVGLAFAARHGRSLGRLIAISGAHRSRAAATAGRLIQRSIITAAIEHGRPELGVALARTLALTSYRPESLFERRFFDDDPAVTMASLHRYLDYNGERFAGHFDAGRYLALSESLDRHRVEPDRITCPVELIAATSDTLVPLTQMRALAGAIGLNARLHVIDSPFGHDAFLKSPERINPLLARLLADVAGGCHDQ